MATIASLPTPLLALREEAGLSLLTDDALAHACGVRVAFAARAGGASEGGYAGLNLGAHVGDDASAVQENRRRLRCALGAQDMPLLVPNQVHRTKLVFAGDAHAASLESVRLQAREGADGIVVSVPRVAALLCFADCVPVVIVSPTGRFAVVHAGWRGALARIASKAALALARLDGSKNAARTCNAYIGPCIHAECFECGTDVRDAFTAAFGAAVVPDTSHVDLVAAVACDLAGAGLLPSRICDADICTVCHANEWFSYRASGGVCGRHGAIAFSTNEEMLHGN